MVPSLDETVLAGLMTIGQDDPEFVARIFGLFEQNAEPAMDKVQTACENNQPAELADAVHALKSMALNIGAARLAATCADIERKAREGEAIDLGSACKDVSRDWARPWANCANASTPPERKRWWVDQSPALPPGRDCCTVRPLNHHLLQQCCTSPDVFRAPLSILPAWPGAGVRDRAARGDCSLEPR
jgi:HPt (histidine-containing phosphotransfer) domain-containing protein